jgi:hypothetical protein
VAGSEGQQINAKATNSMRDMAMLRHSATHSMGPMASAYQVQPTRAEGDKISVPQATRLLKRKVSINHETRLPENVNTHALSLSD